jgi:hypothetical protein
MSSLLTASIDDTVLQYKSADHIPMNLPLNTTLRINTLTMFTVCSRAVEAVL